MRNTKRLQRHRSQYHKGNPRYWILGAPQYSPSQVLRAKRLLKQVSEAASQVKTDFYVWVH
jgi:hypothetical protein